ncbi:MAG: hypothetical protein GVY26_02405 [Bacteroidetes bacterium]|nr:hypothetical protein [Bacteroidota bacterium]
MKLASLPLPMCSILALLFLNACQDAPAPKDEEPAALLFADLYVRYIAPQQQCTASASFRQGDSLKTAQPISLPQPVQFESEEMNAHALPQGLTRYRLDNTSPYQPRNTFTFSPPGGQPTSYQLQLPAVDSFDIIGGSASLSDGMKLYLHGQPLQEGERLVLLFSDAQNKAESITLPGPQFDDTIKLHPLRLRKLSPGPHTLYLVRKVSRDTQLSGIRLRAAAEYYSDSQPFEVVK